MFLCDDITTYYQGIAFWHHFWHIWCQWHNIRSILTDSKWTNYIYNYICVRVCILYINITYIYILYIQISYIICITYSGYILYTLKTIKHFDILKLYTTNSINSTNSSFSFLVTIIMRYRTNYTIFSLSSLVILISLNI